MKPDRLVDIYRRIELTLQEGVGEDVREPTAAGDVPGPDTLGQEQAVCRMLRRIGAIRTSRAGKEACAEVERLVWSVAEHADRSSAAVAATLLTFAGLAPDGQHEGICLGKPACGRCQVGERCRHYAKRVPTIKDLPAHERPRERLLQMGPEAVSDAELLALLIGGGRKDATAVDLARALLARAGGLRQLAGLTAAELAETSGIGDAKAARLLAAFAIARRYASTPLEPGVQFTCSRDIFDHYHEQLRDEKRETFSCVFLDVKHRVVGEERISLGTLKASPVNPREVFRPAIRAAARCIIFVHNHPSGDSTPSADDLNTTRRLVEVAKAIGIRVVDHIIIGDDEYYSFADKGLL